MNFEVQDVGHHLFSFIVCLCGLFIVIVFAVFVFGMLYVFALFNVCCLMRVLV